MYDSISYGHDQSTFYVFNNTAYDGSLMLGLGGVYLLNTH